MNIHERVHDDGDEEVEEDEDHENDVEEPEDERRDVAPPLEVHDGVVGAVVVDEDHEVGQHRTAERGELKEGWFQEGEMEHVRWMAGRCGGKETLNPSYDSVTKGPFR